ncbi:hypothetical protein LUZ60_016747 [Juncus effusus]|nr:hypothetical protein LUZ60_016747 [Juncus effusus]
MGQCSSRKIRNSDRWDDGSISNSEKNGCFAIIREKKAKLYILRKCVMMLICWHKHEKVGFVRKIEGKL